MNVKMQDSISVKEIVPIPQEITHVLVQRDTAGMEEKMEKVALVMKNYWSTRLVSVKVLCKVYFIQSLLYARETSLLYAKF